MKFNKEILLQFVTSELFESQIKHDVHRFSSGAFMIDIWFNTSFYVIQIDDELAGLSKLEFDNLEFSSLPDEQFHTSESFIKKFKSIFGHHSQ